jgi:hypothetical protein
MKTFINHKLCHTSCHACLSSVFLVFLLMPMTLSPNQSYTWAADGTSIQTVLRYIIPMRLQPKQSCCWGQCDFHPTGLHLSGLGTSTQTVLRSTLMISFHAMHSCHNHHVHAFTHLMHHLSSYAIHTFSNISLNLNSS